VSLRSRLPLLGDGSSRGRADVPPSGSPGVADELTPQTERKGEMSFESSGFPSPIGHSGEGHDPAAPESPAPLAPMQPFGEIQPQSAAPAPFEPLRPLEAAPVETFPLQQPETVQLQQPETVQFQQPDPLQPAALEPLHPTMPPPLPLLTTAGPAAEASPPPAAAPVTTPEEVANLGVPLGTLIFRAGLLTEEQLEDALQEGVRSGKRLGEVLLESGLLDERDLGRLLADQKGLRFVELSGIALDPAASALLSAEKAHMFAALPVGFEDGVPLVAVADPSNELVTENLRRALGSEPRLVVASRSDLHSTIDRVHGAVQEEPVAQAEPEALVAAPVATEPVQTAPLAPQPVETQPVAALTPLAPEPVAEPVAVAAELAPEPETTPAPVLQPVQVEHVEPPQPETNGYTTVAPLVPETPETAPVPVAPEPAPAPVVAEPAAVEEPVPAATFSRVEDETPVQTEQEFPSALSYDVSLRLTDGERVAIGSFGDAQKAREYARDVVKHLSDDTDGWPFFSGRFLRPDTILSVDIVPVGEPDRWLGSSVRSNWASRLNR
jgi:Type II secretion system (T2SS), protein E, N-terminal domain